MTLKPQPSITHTIISYMFRSVTKPSSAETRRSLFFHLLYRPLWVLAFLTRSFHAFQFDVNSFQFFTLLIHFPWEMQWSSLEYPPGYAYLIFSWPNPQTGGPGYSFAARLAKKSQAVAFILSRLLHQSTHRPEGDHMKGRVRFVSKADQMIVISWHF